MQFKSLPLILVIDYLHAVVYLQEKELQALAEDILLESGALFKTLAAVLVPEVVSNRISFRSLP